MSLRLTLPIVPFMKSERHDVVFLSLTYDKRIKGPSLGIQTGWVKGGFEGFVIFGSPSIHFPLAQGWANHNKKKMEVVWGSVVAQLESRSGDVFRGVEVFLKELGSGLDVSAALEREAEQENALEAAVS